MLLLYRKEKPMTETESKLPASIQRLLSQAGAHRRGLKILFFGPPKTGKSWALASFPHPIFAIACGEGGIEPYLQPELGDVCVTVSEPSEYEEVLTFSLNDPRYASIVIDNVNLLWEDWMDHWNEHFGGDQIKGGQWRKVKGPWKKLLRDVMISEKHVGMSAWLKDILYKEEEAAPGQKAGLKIYGQDNPQVEKNIPYALDLTFRTGNKLDKNYAPTNIHILKFYGGRRPRSVSPEDLFTGKEWKFDARKPVESVWDVVVKPFYEKWIEGSVEHLGNEHPPDIERGRDGLKEVGDDADVGRLIRLIEKQTDFAHYKAQVYPTDIEPGLLGLSKVRRQAVIDAHEKKKKELSTLS